MSTPNLSSDIDSFVLPSLLGNKLSESNFHYLLFIDTSTQKYPDTSLTGSFYMLTDNVNLQTGVYSTPQIKIDIKQPQITNMNKFLSDKKYCETDNDCINTLNFCTRGAYNKYHMYISPWGCGPTEYDGLGNSMEINDQLKCSTDLKFDSIKCINNLCVGENPQAVCK